MGIYHWAAIAARGSEGVNLHNQISKNSLLIQVSVHIITRRS